LQLKPKIKVLSLDTRYKAAQHYKQGKEKQNHKTLDILVDNEKNLTISLIIILLALLTTFCKRDCKQDTINKGIIVEYLKLNPMSNPDNGVIILDSMAFADMFPHEALTIDFDNYSLLGLYVTDGGCSGSITREVTKLEIEKQYHYKVSMYTCGLCKKEFYDYNWVTVPKLPNGWIVTFEKKIK
jgi:hypothetical protein